MLWIIQKKLKILNVSFSLKFLILEMNLKLRYICLNLLHTSSVNVCRTKEHNAFKETGNKRFRNLALCERRLLRLSRIIGHLLFASKARCWQKSRCVWDCTIVTQSCDLVNTTPQWSVWPPAHSDGHILLTMTGLYALLWT